MNVVWECGVGMLCGNGAFNMGIQCGNDEYCVGTVNTVCELSVGIQCENGECIL